MSATAIGTSSGGPRTVMVDSITSHRPFSFNVYPARVLYDVTDSRLSAPRCVDLGLGGEGPDWSRWSTTICWSRGTRCSSPGATTRSLSGSTCSRSTTTSRTPRSRSPPVVLLPTLGTLFTILFRGNAADTDRDADLQGRRTARPTSAAIWWRAQGRFERVVRRDRGGRAVNCRTAVPTRSSECALHRAINGLREDDPLQFGVDAP